MKSKVLVCGGAGYVGSHMVRWLLDRGHEVVVFDNLSQGNRDAVGGVPLVVGDLLDPDALATLFAAHDFDAVFHFAALIAVGGSVAAPDLFYRNNVTGTLNLLDAMRVAGVDKIVFSSSASIFGNPQTELIDETHPAAPLNPYGASKLMIERVLADYAAAFGLRSVSFRYFNAAGAHPSAQIGEAHAPETHLIPRVLMTALGASDGLEIFGDSYETRDGTCVRDYIHVDDIASAHLAALPYLDTHPGAHAFNLGNGKGFTNREIIAAAERVIGTAARIPFTVGPPRQGDAAVLVADSRAARDALGWIPLRPDIEDIIESAWTWHRAPKYGPFAR